MTDSHLQMDTEAAEVVQSVDRIQKWRFSWVQRIILQSQYMNNQIEEQNKFKQTLTDFLLASGVIRTSSELEIKQNAFKLYQLVCRRGGFQAVTNRKGWGQIGSELEQDGSSLKRLYRRYIFPYEKRTYFGQQSVDEQPNMILGEPRKMVKVQSQVKPKNEEYLNLQNEISRTLEQDQQTKKLFYLKKNKLNTSKAEIKKIVLGLDPFMSRRDVIYSLNMLILYSVNTHHPFLFENHQKIFTALSNYATSLYPPKNELELQDLRTVTLIFRNLTLNPINLKYILGSAIFQLFVTMFNIGFDPQCSKNIVDIMYGLVKVGWDCQQILNEINNAVLQDKMEEVEASVELLRGLIDERDQNLAPAVTHNIKPLLRVLMSTDINIEVKQQIFQILAFVTDISSQSRQELLKNDTLLSIIIGILQHMKSQEKLTQFVALTLSNMSSSSTAKVYLKNYETELMTIGFSDDSLAGIISNILSELSH